jgi:hypothetical protein
MLWLSSGSPDPLKIVLSANTASIRGTAPPGTPVGYRDLDDKLSFRLSVQVEQDEQFRIEGLAPGRYRVAAGESPDALKTAAERSPFRKARRRPWICVILDHTWSGDHIWLVARRVTFSDSTPRRANLNGHKRAPKLP